MTRNEVRVSDGDLEMLAIKAIGQALEPLSRDIRRRVLNWAGDRYVNSEVTELSNEADKLLTTFTLTIQQIVDAADRVGVQPRHYTIVAEKLIKEATELAENERETVSA